MKRQIIVLITFLLSVQLPAVEKWGIFELALEGRKVDNPFTDAELSAAFRYENQTYLMVKVQDSDSYGLKRLESKHARNAIIQKLFSGLYLLIRKKHRQCRLNPADIKGFSVLNLCLHKK